MNYRPPTFNPGAGRSSRIWRRKRKRAAGRPPVAAVSMPVGSTSSAPSTRRRKFCLCRWRPEMASTVAYRSVSVNSGGISSKITGRYLILPRSRATAVATMRRWSWRMVSPIGGVAVALVRPSMTASPTSPAS